MFVEKLVIWKLEWANKCLINQKWIKLRVFSTESWFKQYWFLNFFEQPLEKIVDEKVCRIKNRFSEKLWIKTVNFDQDSFIKNQNTGPLAKNRNVASKYCDFKNDFFQKLEIWKVSCFKIKWKKVKVDSNWSFLMRKLAKMVVIWEWSCVICVCFKMEVL